MPAIKVENLSKSYLVGHNAAFGCAQLEQLPDCESNDWLQTLILDEGTVNQRNAILAATNDAGLMTRPAWTPMANWRPNATARGHPCRWRTPWRSGSSTCRVVRDWCQPADLCLEFPMARREKEPSEDQ